ncbi:MCE family protein [Nocardioides sp.]|uniref:MCE family protein n=1 Tax=Nocardioides sp. TaxID=35761 RepID=UPI003512126A
MTRPEPGADAAPAFREPATLARRPRIPTSAYKMAVFAAVTVVLLGVLATLIGNISLADTRTFYARFTDATGVLAGDRVRLSGVEVGQVAEVSLVPGEDGTQDALVAFEVREGVPIYTDVALELRYENIVGQRYLAVVSPPTGEPAPAGTTFGLDRTTPALNLTEVFNGFQPLLRALEPEQTNALAYEVVRAFQGEAGAATRLLSDTASLTATLADKDAVIGRVVGNLNDVLGSLDTRDSELTALIVRFRDLMVGLSSDRDTISVALPQLERLLGAGSGFVRDIRPGLADTARALARVARQLRVDRADLADSLAEIPPKLRFMTRAGSYGSWFNFYVCGAEVRVKLLGDTLYLGTPSLAGNERDTVCAGPPVVRPDSSEELGTTDPASSGSGS